MINSIDNGCKYFYKEWERYTFEDRGYENIDRSKVEKIKWGKKPPNSPSFFSLVQ